MEDLRVDFKELSDTEDKTVYELTYKGERYLLHVSHDGKFHNNLYESDRKIPEELTWFVDTIVRRELNGN
jgi:hypothetical protein